MVWRPLRGFRDILPPDAAHRAWIAQTIRAVAQRAGFEEVETPSVEALELLKVKSGEAIVEETFSFRDKGGREVTLVPENTPSVARLLASRAKAEAWPVKWVAFSKLWRYEEPQAGRTREFSQCSLDIFGVPGVEAELELLGTSAAIFEALGVAEEVVFRVNDRRLAQGLGAALGNRDPDRLLRVLDRREKLPPEEFARELGEAGLDEGARSRFFGLLEAVGSEGSNREALARLREGTASWGLGPEAVEGLSSLERLFALGTEVGLEASWRFDPLLARGLAYYTGTVFEAYDRRGEFRALFGGGRYDRLIELFGGGPVPACGLAIGDLTVELLLRRAGRWPSVGRGPEAYVAVASPELKPRSLSLVHRLRRAGFSTEHDLLDRPLGRQMKEAARRRARTVVLLAPEELSRGEVVLRNMQSGQQEAVPFASVEERLSHWPASPSGAPTGAPAP
jgi:histidyl-tRNA synthetase